MYNSIVLHAWRCVRCWASYRTEYLSPAFLTVSPARLPFTRMYYQFPTPEGWRLGRAGTAGIRTRDRKNGIGASRSDHYTNSPKKIRNNHDAFKNLGIFGVGDYCSLRETEV